MTFKINLAYTSALIICHNNIKVSQEYAHGIISKSKLKFFILSVNSIVFKLYSFNDRYILIDVNYNIYKTLSIIYSRIR